MIGKHGKPLDTRQVCVVAYLTCNELVSAIKAGKLFGCPECKLFIKDSPTCPHCTSVVRQVSEDELADGVFSDTEYRVCAHCDFAFFWTDEVVFRNANGSKLDADDGEPMAEDAEGPVKYVCPGCGKAVP